MSREDVKIVERFLKQNKTNEYHLITQEVYDAILKLVNKSNKDAEIADSFRALKGHLDSMKLYKDKEYSEGFNTCIERSFEIIDKSIDKLTEDD